MKDTWKYSPEIRIKNSTKLKKNILNKIWAYDFGKLSDDLVLKQIENIFKWWENKKNQLLFLEI